MIPVYFGPLNLWLWCHKDDMHKIGTLYDVICDATTLRSAIIRTD